MKLPWCYPSQITTNSKKTSFIFFVSDSTSCLISQDNLEHQNARLTLYRNYLQSRYKDMLSTSSTQWPPLPTTKVFKLAMIQKEKIQRGKIDNDFIRLSITGKVDDILQLKTPVDIKNIFTICGDKRRFVLIEGAPGSGKSTLTLHICQEWAEGRLFQEYHVVILVRLRDPLIKDAKTVAEILPRVNKTMAEKIECIMTSMYGRGVLWVLDGWDELSSDLTSDSIIQKLIQPSMFQESPLHQSSVIVTSRPSSSATLHTLVSSRVEVIGFTPRELEQYFRECLKDDSRAVQALLERIRENPVVEGSCYLPLNAAIVVHVFLSGNHSLPTSNHGIFMEVIKSSLKRYLQDRLGIMTSVRSITSPDSVPLEIQTPVSHLCRLAFHGIKGNQITFSEGDLTALTVSKDIAEVGLLQIVASIASDGHQIYYCFLHLSIQELLAAVHISRMSPKQQISVFQELFTNPRFSAVFQFYAGITKLKISRPWLSLIPRFLCPVPASLYDLVKKILKPTTHQMINTNYIRSLVSLLHCLYEAEDLSLYAFVASLTEHLLVFDNILSPLDCLAIGNFISVVATVKGFYTASLQGCSISDQECKFLVQGLSKPLNTHSKKTIPRLYLSLASNNIHDKGFHCIAQLLKNTSVVRKLDLSDNRIGENGLKSLCEALSTNTTLQTLHLANCGLILDEENGLSLCQLLSTNTSLCLLDLSANKVTDCLHIAIGLSNNRTLRTLLLPNL